MRVGIGQAGDHEPVVGVDQRDPLAAMRARRTDRRDNAILDQHVGTFGGTAVA
jgi:hypothetical protein